MLTMKDGGKGASREALIPNLRTGANIPLRVGSGMGGIVNL